MRIWMWMQCGCNVNVQVDGDVDSGEYSLKKSEQLIDRVRYKRIIDDFFIEYNSLNYGLSASVIESVFLDSYHQIYQMDYYQMDQIAIQFIKEVLIYLLYLGMKKDKRKTKNKSNKKTKLIRSPFTNNLSTLQVTPNKQLKTIKSKSTKPTSSKVIQKDQSSMTTIHLNLTAKAYGLFNSKLWPIKQLNSEKPLQIASLAKLMTYYTVIYIVQTHCQDFQSAISKLFIRIPVQACQVTGSSAELSPKQWMTLKDLLFGMMVPSGNDASLALALSFGGLLTEKQKYLQQIEKKNYLDITNAGKDSIASYQQRFIECMNFLAKQELKLENSMFQNPHGLDQKQSYSSVKDLAKLMEIIDKKPLCREIMGCRKYNGNSNVFPEDNGCPLETDWINTNQLLWKKGYIAGKTGQTPKAGNCLASIYQTQCDEKYYVIVLGCQKINDRFIETQKLIDYVINQK